MSPSTETSGKPADIPQDVWDAAWKLQGSTTYDEAVFNGADSPALLQACQDDAEAIARAIMAAKAEEREAAAQVVESYPPKGFNEALYLYTERLTDHDPFWAFSGDTGNWAWFMGEVLKPYADAIRKRGEG